MSIAEKINPQHTPFGLATLRALGRPGSHVYAGTVPAKVVASRRARNRAARRARRVHRQAAGR